jgi:hypothetical protein
VAIEVPAVVTNEKPGRHWRIARAVHYRRSGDGGPKVALA